MFASRTRRTPPNFCSASDGGTTKSRGGGGGRSDSPPLTKQAEHLNEMAAVKLLQISLLLFKWVPEDPLQSFFSPAAANRAVSENYNIYFCGVCHRLIPIYWSWRPQQSTYEQNMSLPDLATGEESKDVAEINDNVGHAECDALDLSCIY